MARTEDQLSRDDARVAHLKSMGRYAIVAILLVLLGLTVWWAVWVWNAGGPVEISGHGYAAMTLGIIFSLLVGAGLMGLVFYSARKGYDDPAGHERR